MKDEADHVHAELLRWGFVAEADDLAAKTDAEERRTTAERYGRALSFGRQGNGPFAPQMAALAPYVETT